MDAISPVGARIAVADALAWDGIGLRLVGRPVGLGRDIRWAVTTELLDPSPYLHGGELVLTTGMSLRAPADCASFVASLAPTAPAAIGFAVGIGHDAVPPALVVAANRAGIPVLEVPPAVAFVSLTERIAVERAHFGALTRERQSTGALVDAVRRGLASAAVLLPSLSTVGGDRWSVLATDAWALPAALDGAVIGTVGETAVAILEPQRLDAALARLSRPAGWSGPADERALAGAIREALAAHHLGLRSGETTGPQQLASWEGLMQRLTDEQLAPFRSHVLGPLLAYDLRHRSSLIETVEAFIRHGASVQETARALLVHANTVRQRLGRVRAVVGLDALVEADRMGLAVALASRR